MKQALHIFKKDVRALWPQIAAMMLTIALFAAIDIGFSPINQGINFIEILAGAAVWFLIARAIHEESIPGENQFWLTRPYERSSLLISKLMMVVFAVSLPFFVADCLILSFQSLSVTGNLGGLILRQAIVGAWLILPPFAVASVTRNITEDVMVWLAGLAIAGLTYFPNSEIRSDVRSIHEKYVLAVGCALLAAVVWRQYRRRGTNVSRGLVAVAVLVPALPLPQGPALAIEQRVVRQDSGASAISFASVTDHIVVPGETIGYTSGHDRRCAPIGMTVAQVRPDWRIAILGEAVTFESRRGQRWGSGWYTTYNNWLSTSGTEGTFMACADSATLTALGDGEPVAVHISLAVAVLANDPPIKVSASARPFDVPDVGQCQFVLDPRIRLYVLACKAPVRVPPRFSWADFSMNVLLPFAPMNLLPGMSPVFKWVARGDQRIQDAMATGEQIELRPERQIALLRREVDVREVRFLTASSNGRP